MELELFVTSGLGDNSYLVASGGEAVLIDPQRDAWRFLAVAGSRKVAVRYVLETHVHNDYVSGAMEVRSATGAEVAAPAKGNYEFPHRRMAEGDEVRVGALRLVAMDTPGHTPEHIAWLVYEDGSKDPTAVFTGGSLMVRSSGRTDLLGPEHADTLARAQYATLRRLTALPEMVQVLPTHGAGSFCASTAPAMARTTTIGQERDQNPTIAVPDEETFVQRQLSGLLAYPAYYRHIAPINRKGPRILGGPPRPRALSPEEVARRMEAGVWVVDGRDRLAFAEAHLPGSVNIELNSQFASYTGWVTPFNSSLVLVLPEPVKEALETAVIQLVRIGYEQVEGYLDGGIEAWRSTGRQARSYAAADLDDLCQISLSGQPVRILDVRQRGEWDAGHIPDSLHVFVGDLPEHVDRVPKDKEVWSVCASGQRASIAASLLDRAGVPVRLVARGGVPDWLAGCYPGEAALGSR